MTVTSADVKVPAQDSSIGAWVTVLVAWHVALAIGAAGAIIYLVSTAETAAWLRLLLTVIAGLVCAGAALPRPVLVFRRRRRGRLLSIGINYLLFIASLVLLLAAWNVFNGLDSLADTFMRGIPFLILIFLDWFISSGLSGRAEHDPRRRRTAQLIGRITAIAGLAGLLISVGIFSGARALLIRYTNPATIGLTMLTIALGIMLWAMWRRPMADEFGATNADGEMLSGYLFLSPNLIGFLLFFAGPLLLSL